MNTILARFLLAMIFMSIFGLLSCSTTTVSSYCKKQCEDRGEIHILKTDTMVCNCD